MIRVWAWFLQLVIGRFTSSVFKKLVNSRALISPPRAPPRATPPVSLPLSLALAHLSLMCPPSKSISLAISLQETGAYFLFDESFRDQKEG